MLFAGRQLLRVQARQLLRVQARQQTDAPNKTGGGHMLTHT
jgi:hypothetical protein